MTYLEKINPGDKMMHNATEIASRYGILSEARKPHTKMIAKWLSTRPNYKTTFYYGGWGSRFSPVYRFSYYEKHMRSLCELLNQEKPAGEITICDCRYRYFLQENKGESHAGFNLPNKA